MVENHAMVDALAWNDAASPPTMRQAMSLSTHREALKASPAPASAA